jgi:hypothetical protein
LYFGFSSEKVAFLGLFATGLASSLFQQSSKIGFAFFYSFAKRERENDVILL